jgi:hypothetical protein
MAGEIIFMQESNSEKTAVEMLKLAYRNCMNSLQYYIDKQLKMAELKITWILIYAIIPPTYIYAAATNFDTWKAVFLFLLAGATGILALARLSIKFFKELLDVLVAYREKRVSIEGIKQLYVIIALLILIIILIAFILYLSLK